MSGDRFVIPGAQETPSGLIAPGAAASQLEQAWPSGKAPPHGGWDPYLHGIHLIAELGLMRVHSKNLLLRAVMPGSKRSTLHRPGISARKAICFTVEAIAPDVDPAELFDPARRPHGLKVGDEVIHLSASADPIAPSDSDCPFFFVALEDLAGSWDVAVLEAVLAGTERMDLDQLKAHVQTWLDEHAQALTLDAYNALGQPVEVPHVRADGKIRHARIQSRKPIPRE